MAILCLSENLDDLKERISKIIVAYNKEGNPVTAKDLNAQGSMALLLKDAIKPNLVQTIENTPVFIHGGPFGNIAHGCSSIISTKLALKLSDYVITEAGFGADLGAEKFLDIKCRVGNLKPDVAVIVATIKALKYNAGVKKEDLHLEDNHAVSIGFENLEHHILNLRTYGIPVVVALNHFTGDFDSEVDQFLKNCASVGVPVEISKIWEQGGTGGEKLANLVIETINTENSDSFQYIYDENQPIKEKVDLIVKNIYGGIGTVYSTTAEKTIKEIEKLGLDKLPICIAKTQYSISDQPNLLGRPTGFKISVREIRLSAGAGFIVVIAGDIMTMPGLPKNPASNAIDVSSDGQPIGLR
ncbi:Formate--tetrahydrofolate ligase [compost metagenome]